MTKILTLVFSLFITGMVAQNASWQHFFPTNSATCVAARGNTILVGALDGNVLTRFDTAGNATFFNAFNSGGPPRFIQQVAIDYAGNWWLQHGSGIARYDGNTWTDWDSTGVGLPVSNTIFTALEAAPDGRILASTSGAGIAIFDQGSWTIMNTLNSGLPANSVRDIAVGNDGLIYIATSAGLAITDGSNWTVFNATNTGLSNFNNIKSVTVTATGTVWVTEGANRFAKIAAGNVTEYLPSDIGLTGAGLSGKVEVDEQDRLWISFTKSISRFDGTSWIHHNETEIGCTLPPMGAKLATDGAGQLWTTACGLTLFKDQNWRKLELNNEYLPSGQIFAMTEDKAGNIWFAGDRGVTRKTNDGWQAFSAAELGTPASLPRCFTAHGDAVGHAWFGTEDGEILRYDGLMWTVFDTVKTVFPGFASFWAIASDKDGAVWFSFVPPAALGARLVRYKAGEWSFFTPDDAPLPSNQDIVGIVVRADQTAWFLSSNDRLLKYDGGAWTVFDPHDSGVPYTIARSMTLAPDDAIWITTNAGLIRFDGTTWTTLSTANSALPFDDTWTLVFDKAGGMFVGTNPIAQGVNCGVLRSGIWTDLVPPGFEPGFSSQPKTMLADSGNRFWFANWNSAGVFLYDPMLVNTVEKNSANRQITVCPNPVLGTLSINLLDETDQAWQVRIFDAYGRQVFQQTNYADVHGLVFEVPSMWPTGVYYLEILSETGERRMGRFTRAGIR